MEKPASIASVGVEVSPDMHVSIRFQADVFASNPNGARITAMRSGDRGPLKTG